MMNGRCHRISRAWFAAAALAAWSTYTAKADWLLSQNDIPPNLQTVTISASSTWSGDGATNAIDGNTSTYWLASGFSPQQLTLNLQQAYPITSISLLPNNGSPGGTINFTLRGSTNGLTFSGLIDTNGSAAAGTLVEGQASYSSFYFDGSTAYQYIQVDCTGGTSWPNITELQVYGTIPEPVTATAAVAGLCLLVAISRIRRMM
jgi:hypothetical protein